MNNLKELGIYSLVKQVSNLESVGTCYQGLINASQFELGLCFGDPEMLPENQIEWYLLFERADADPVRATIYGTNLGTNFHIGGDSKEAVELVHKFLNEV